MSTNELISNLVERQLPEFVRQDHPNFIRFLEAYYEYLEQSNSTLALGKTIERATNLLNYKDIDYTIDAFARQLYKQYLALFPEGAITNKPFILKHIKDFYRARGTEKSYRFLFRAVFGEEIDFYYPKTDILIASSGTWFIERSVKITDVSVTINGVTSTPPSIAQFEQFENAKLVGQVSKAFAFIERVSIYYSSGIQIFEVFVSNVNGVFNSGEVVEVVNVNGDTLTASILTGVVTQINVLTGGSKYNIGDPVIITTANGDLGFGAVATVSQVSSGNIGGFLVIDGGAGFRVNDTVSIVGGGGTGANAIVGGLAGIANSFYHPNTYNINSDLISPYGNTTLNTASYGFPADPTANANTPLNTALQFFTFGITGPIANLQLISAGNNYSSFPFIDVIGNTRIKTLGILGRMNIANPGLHYNVGDQLIFTNVIGGMGTGAIGNVASVNANGAIMHVQFVDNPGYITGGAGYDINHLPTVSINTAAGVNGHVIVTTLLGFGVPHINISGTTGIIGAIEKITVLFGGQGYQITPLVDLTHSGDGLATATANIVAGIYTYPGRFLDDTGWPSGFNFLQNRDYYQNYAYVIKVEESINSYRKFVKALLHPAGMKLWGEYDQTPVEMNLELSIANTDYTQQVYYGANAVYFNGSTYLTTTAPLTGYTSDSSGSISLWFDPYTLPANSSEAVLFSTGSSTNGNTVIVSLANTTTPNTYPNYIRMVAKEPGGNIILAIRSNNSGVIQCNSWINLLLSYDFSNVQNTINRVQIYASNVNVGAIVDYRGPADIVPQDLVAAFGLRRLRYNYTGYCCLVRRSSDNVNSNIGFTSSGDFDANSFNTFIGSNTAYLIALYNQSSAYGNTLDEFQYTPTSESIVKIKNGFPVVIASGNTGNNLVSLTNTSIDWSNITVSVVANCFNDFDSNNNLLSAGGGSIVGSSDSGFTQGWTLQINPYFVIFANVAAPFGANANAAHITYSMGKTESLGDGEFHTEIVRMSPSSGDLLQDGIYVDTSGGTFVEIVPGSFGNTSNLPIVLQDDTSSGHLPYRGEYKEILVWKRFLSNTQSHLVHLNQQYYWRTENSVYEDESLELRHD